MLEVAEKPWMLRDGAGGKTPRGWDRQEVHQDWRWVMNWISDFGKSPLYKDQRSHFKSCHVVPKLQPDIMLELWQGGLELQREYRG